MNVHNHNSPLRRAGQALFLLLIGSITQAAELLQLSTGSFAATDEFGYATVADAQRVIVGAPGENNKAGAVYVFDCSVAGCLQEARIAANDLASGHTYGSALAFSGNTLAVAAPSQGAGAVYIYIRTAPGVWTQQAKLTDIGGAVGERFGSAIALLGNTLLVGASGDNSNRGSAFAFNRSGTTWALPTLLLAPDGVSGDGFGTSVALSADHALIGAPFEGNAGAGQTYARGAVYAFERMSPTVWSGAPSKFLAASPQSGALFGHAVALQNHRGIVGVPNAGDGRVAVFEFASGTGWSAVADFTSENVKSQARFGWSLALDSDRLTVGAPFDANEPGRHCGITLQFERIASVWTETASLRLRNTAPGDFSGWSLVNSGPRQAVGIPGLSNNSAQNVGSVAWFDPAELVFANALESPHPSCAQLP